MVQQFNKMPNYIWGSVPYGSSYNRVPAPKFRFFLLDCCFEELILGSVIHNGRLPFVWNTIFGKPFLENRFWKTVFGKPFLESRFWKTVFGKPFLENRFWKTVFGKPFLENPYWKAVFGKPFL